MLQETIVPPRRLKRAWLLLRHGLPSLGRYRRYIIAISVPVGIIWALTVLYLVAAPVSYTSKMTLILPGSGVGGSLNVDQLGQASNVTASAFSSPTLSPTENYKRLLMADVTLARAAERLHMPAGAFPKPEVKLTDQTNLIEVSLKARSPARAHDELAALRWAFLASLDLLRTEEAQERENANREEIARLEHKAREAQHRLLDFQAHSGLISIEQFNGRIAALDALRDKYRQALTTQRQQDAQTSRLAHALGANVEQARAAMLLKADPLFQSLLGRYAQIRTGLAEKSATLGDRHALVSQLSAQDRILHDQLAARGAMISGMDQDRLMRFVDQSVSDGRSALFQVLVNDDSQASGAGAAVREIERQIAEQNEATRNMAGEAAMLADLDRDLKVADVVFSSALARLDTNKADPFASYPLVLTLEAPSVPTRRTSPSPLLALAGALGGSLFVLIGFGLAWIRQPIIHLMLRKP
jgi:uncharacterized protein involved in exopolysaccharide biosynthesis